MRRGCTIFLTIILSLGCQVFAQNKDSIQYLYFVDENPKFQGDENGTLFTEYVLQEMGNSAIEVPDSVTGRIVVLYVVDSTGFITDVKLIDSIGSSYDYEALRIILNSPQWEPGKVNGKPVRTTLTFPITVQSDDNAINNGATYNEDLKKDKKRKRRK